MRCSGSISISLSSSILMIFSSTPRAWPNIATTLRRSWNAWENSICSSNALSINPQCSSLDATSIEVAFRWMRGRWKPLKTGLFLPSEELQRFLGFSNFYSRLIHNYNYITSPLTNLLKNKPKSLSGHQLSLNLSNHSWRHSPACCLSNRGE